MVYAAMITVVPASNKKGITFTKIIFEWFA
jgi:hypothetical protein